MFRVLATIAIAALATGSTLAQEAAMPTDAQISQILSDRIGRDQANVGIAAAVIENGETRFVSHGTLSKTDDTSVTENTPFEAGSITKIFTNLILSDLAVEGLIDLDAPILGYLPEGAQMPIGGEAITAFDLATHTAGLTGLPAPILERGFDNPYAGFDSAALFAWLGEQPLARPIGESFEYSNLGASILGQAIEELTGEPYAAVVEARIFEPLGMNASSLSLTGEKPAGMAVGHMATGDETGYWEFDAAAPAGALITTAADLSKFIAAASGAVETPLRPAFDKMLEQTRPIADTGSIGLGWFINPTGSGEIVWHNGRTGGFASFAGFERNSGNAVVLLSNMSTDAGINDIGMHLLDPSLPLREQPMPRVAVEIDPAVLSEYVGDYVLAPGVTLSITTQDDKLFAQLTGQGALEIFPESETDFFYKVVDAQITFSPEDGTLVLHQNGQNLNGMRVE